MIFRMADNSGWSLALPDWRGSVTHSERTPRGPSAWEGRATERSAWLAPSSTAPRIGPSCAACAVRSGVGSVLQKYLNWIQIYFTRDTQLYKHVRNGPVFFFFGGGGGWGLLPKYFLQRLPNKSPRGLNAHLNWRKLPLVHIGVCYQLEKLWRPSPWLLFT